MKKITLQNNFHNAEVSVHLKDEQTHLSPSQTRRVEKTLCGMDDCHCGTVRGPQDGFDVEWAYNDVLVIIPTE